MAVEKKRICMALGNVKVENAISDIIHSKFARSYEIAENVRSKEALLTTLKHEKFDVLILREDLTGNIDLIDMLKTIRQENNDLQIIFFMNHRENGDPFYVEIFLFNIYDFVVLPEVDLNTIFSFLASPRKFKDIIRFLPVRAERIHNLIVEANTDMKKPPKLAKDGDVDDVVEINISKKQQKKQTQTPEPRFTPNLQNERITTSQDSGNTVITPQGHITGPYIENTTTTPSAPPVGGAPQVDQYPNSFTDVAPQQPVKPSMDTPVQPSIPSIDTPSFQEETIPQKIEIGSSNDIVEDDA